MSALRSLAWEGESLRLLDQTKLPTEITYLSCRDYREVADAIRILAYRECLVSSDISAAFHHACQEISAARPTAVNLSWAVSEMEKVFDRYPAKEAEDALLARARDIEAEDIHTCRSIGENGADLFQGRKGLRILTHCNTGALATAGIGTAFGVLSVLHERGAIECVYADETRPLLQGSRLTATELMEGHIPCCLISDTMSASVMRDKKIDAIIVGADRIAANGDTANKIGTYGLAVMAAYHHIPFYIASGKEIVIEERDPDEVRKFAGVYSAPKDVPVYNPAFDVTPSSLIAGIITEKGVLKAPYEAAIARYKKELSK